MRGMNDREKRLVRFGGIGLGIYLVLFFVAKPVQKQRADYQALVKDADALRARVEPYEGRAMAVQKLMDTYQFDPAKLSKSNVVGEASAALQKAAAGSGVQVGPVRESPAHGAGKELASVQFEGTGPVPAVMGLLKRIETIGYPMVIDSVQITPETRGPGMVKMSLTIVILDFEQWTKEGKPHA